MNAEAWVVIVMPSLLALTATLAALTGGPELGPGLVPAPPEPAKATPGMSTATPAAARIGAR
jgi:hypothetical protein